MEGSKDTGCGYRSCVYYQVHRHWDNAGKRQPNTHRCAAIDGTRDKNCPRRASLRAATWKKARIASEIAVALLVVIGFTSIFFPNLAVSLWSCLIFLVGIVLGPVFYSSAKTRE
jgi:hypothetical protein